MTDTLRVLEKPDGMSRVTLRPAFGGWSLGLERRDDPEDEWEGCSGCWELFTDEQMAAVVDLLVRRNTDTVETPLRLPENGDSDSDETAADVLRRVAETADALKAAGLRVRVDVTLTVTMPPETPENGERPHTHTRGIDRGDCPECDAEYGEQL